MRMNTEAHKLIQKGKHGQESCLPQSPFEDTITTENLLNVKAVSKGCELKSYLDKTAFWTFSLDGTDPFKKQI